MHAFHSDLIQAGSYIRETEAQSAEEAAPKAELGGKCSYTHEYIQSDLTSLMDSAYRRKRGRIR